VSRKDTFIQETLPGMLEPIRQSAPYVPPAPWRYDPEYKKPEQLAMFKTPKEIMDAYDPLKGDMRPGESARMTWRRKAEEGRIGLSGNSRVEAFSEESPDTLENSIKQTGVQNPVTLQTKDFYNSFSKPQIFGGHHRIATAAKINPDMLIPVEYAETFDDASTNRRKQGDDPGSPDAPRFPYDIDREPAPSSSSSKSSSSNKS
jgi:hypothetical protein